MVHHTACMLDDMITAVDVGFSYDGIVSVPETGLEDVKYQRSSLRESMDRIRMRGAVISRGAARIFKQTQQHDSRPRSEDSVNKESRSELSLVSSNPRSVEFTPGLTQVVQVRKGGLHGENLLKLRRHLVLQPCIAPRPDRDDDIGTAYNCFSGLPFMNRTRCKPVGVKCVHASPPNQKRLHKTMEEDWDVVSPVQESLGMNGEMRWRS
ncbi:hypothetical protein V8E55_003227 [Tylopilus felleus]